MTMIIVIYNAFTNSINITIWL